MGIKGKGKKLLYIKIYDKLMADIKKGIYKEGDQLPSEPDLSKQLGISRMTLRQALGLLKEDGVLNNIRGKGNFIIKRDPDISQGIESRKNPVHVCITKDIDHVDFAYRFETISSYMEDILESKPALCVTMDRWYKIDDEYKAYSVSFMPIEVVSERGIDFKDENGFLDFIENQVYDYSEKSKIKIKTSEIAHFTSHNALSREREYFLLEEALYRDGNVVIYNKHYIPMSISQIEVEL